MQDKAGEYTCCWQSPHDFLNSLSIVLYLSIYGTPSLAPHLRKIRLVKKLIKV